MTTELQDELAARWDEIGLDGTGERHLVVLPSMTIDIPPPLLARAAPDLLPLEQRLICMLPLLLQPGTSLVYLTSATVSPTVADSWFGLVPGLDTVEARRRLTLLSAHDPSPRPLAAKLLERPAWAPAAGRPCRRCRPVRGLGGDGLLLVAAGELDAAGLGGLVDRDGQRSGPPLPPLAGRAPGRRHGIQGLVQGAGRR